MVCQNWLVVSSAVLALWNVNLTATPDCLRKARTGLIRPHQLAHLRYLDDHQCLSRSCSKPSEINEIVHY